MRKAIREMFVYVGIMTVVCLSWQLLELAIMGDINPNGVDSIIGTVLTISLYENFKSWERSKG